MPVAIDSNSRPGSTNSVPMGNNKNCGGSNSNGVNMNAAAPPVRPTTTSRRGGRSRSPVSTAIVVNRQHQQQQMAANNTHHGARNSKNTSGLGSHNNNNSNNTPSPAAGSGEGENPSLAAAAAAAAAAAYATGRGPPWPPQPPEGLPEDASGGYPHHLPPMYATDKVSYPPPNNWPGEDSYRRGGGGGGGGGYPGGGYDSRSPFPRDDYGDRRYHREPSSRYDDPRRYGPPRGMPPGQPYPPPPPDYHRYSGGQQHLPPPSHHRSRGVAQQHRLPPPPPHEHHHRPYHHRVEPQQHQPRVRRSGGDESRDLLLPLRSDLRSGKATNLVMGGATPIHLPKSPVVSSKQLLQKQQPPQPHRGSASSVFRGRPERNGSCSPVADNPDDENSPQKILLSFRTPTTSFEELKDKSSLVSSSNAAAKRKAADLLVGGGGGPSPEIHPNSQEDSPDHLFGVRFFAGADFLKCCLNLPVILFSTHHVCLVLVLYVANAQSRCRWVD